MQQARGVRCIPSSTATAPAAPATMAMSFDPKLAPDEPAAGLTLASFLPDAFAPAAPDNTAAAGVGPVKGDSGVIRALGSVGEAGAASAAAAAAGASAAAGAGPGSGPEEASAAGAGAGTGALAGAGPMAAVLAASMTEDWELREFELLVACCQLTRIELPKAACSDCGCAAILGGAAKT